MIQGWMMNRRLGIVILLCVMGSVVLAQDAGESPTHEPVTSENIRYFRSIQQLNFADLSLALDTGQFWLDETGKRIAMADEDAGRIFIFTDEGQLDFSYSMSIPEGGAEIVTMIDAAFGELTTLYDLHVVDGDVFIGELQIDVPGLPQALWVRERQSDGAEQQTLYVEYVEAGTAGNAASIAEFTVRNGELLPSVMIPYAPGEDDTAVVRIGRIPLPYVVTSSLDGEVKLWDVETGEVLVELDNGTGEPSVFGNINRDATHLVWRDNANQSLYLLDFETGHNQYVAALEGAYAQWYFLSNDASLILAVNLDNQPNVVAWDVATGERTVLGEYRPCGRPQPDMARLSADGTTLVIGCPTGLDLWRVAVDG